MSSTLNRPKERYAPPTGSIVLSAYEHEHVIEHVYVDVFVLDDVLVLVADCNTESEGQALKVPLVKPVAYLSKS